ncbi:mitogen-activated protein kinase 10-like protein [Cinnamomum micranthum f. kanehirae]|uniref:Mitogen-activated protein kinase 10-like protein n=1 Tax=Cinnamomum micranthum f. kanehirae TaxID=337451 RepID=A0A443P6F6_9MAGN|nr:mitogen-activated protein kinase 10-like protein [Cinnamomum micranthum f. kanehirae]
MKEENCPKGETLKGGRNLHPPSASEEISKAPFLRFETSRQAAARAPRQAAQSSRWRRVASLSGSIMIKYTKAIDIWSIGCTFAEVLTGKPLFPGTSSLDQLHLITDLLGTPSLDTISRIKNVKARRYLSSMRKKQPVPFALKFPNADSLARKLLKRLLAFDPKDRPTAEEALADAYFNRLANAERKPSCQQISKIEFDFERRKLRKEDIKELIFQEILNYHPQLLNDYNGIEATNFFYPRFT